MTAKRSLQVTPRKVPAQARSKKRVAAIVDAAAVLFADQGFDATTTDAIAAAAGTSIGSVYQFFPNKLSLFQAISERCLAECKETVFTELADHDPGDWATLLEHVIDTFVRLQRTNANFRALYSNLELYDVYAAADDAMNRLFAERVELLFAVLAPDLPKAKRRRIAITLVQVITGALVSLSRLPKNQAKGFIVEIKQMLYGYVSSYLN